MKKRKFNFTPKIRGELRKKKYRCAGCNGLPWECTCSRTTDDLAQWLMAVGEDVCYSVAPKTYLAFRKLLP